MADLVAKIPPHEGSISWRWVLGMTYTVIVALVWIGSSFVVQAMVDDGVSPFLFTYICNSLFVILIPIVELKRFITGETMHGRGGDDFTKLREKLPQAVAIGESDSLLENEQTHSTEDGAFQKISTKKEISDDYETIDGNGPGIPEVRVEEGNGEKEEFELAGEIDGDSDNCGNERWSRKRTALIGLTICPFWFLAQFNFNLSLTFTTVTSNTILSTTSSLFTFLVSLQFLGERFTWFKLVSVLLCMAGTVLVSLGDSWKEGDETASNPFLGDLICLLSAVFYAIYTALIRANIPDDEERKGNVSTALVFGYIGLFNALLLAPVAAILHFSGFVPLKITLLQFGIIVGKGLFDNVLSDYLWARAVLLTTPTAATAGLTIQVPIAAVIDSIRGIIPSYMEILGAIAVLVGFFGINQPDPVRSLPPPELTEKVTRCISQDDTSTVSSTV